MAGAPSGTKVVLQRATKNDFNVIVAPAVYSDVDVTMKLKPIFRSRGRVGRDRVSLDDLVIRGKAL